MGCLLCRYLVVVWPDFYGCIWIVISTYVYCRTCIGLESIAVVFEQEMDMLQLETLATQWVGSGCSVG